MPSPPPDETPLAKSPSHSLLGRAVEVLADAFAERVAVALDRILRARAAQADESWGIVSQKTLPPWIHRSMRSTEIRPTGTNRSLSPLPRTLTSP